MFQKYIRVYQFHHRVIKKVLASYLQNCQLESLSLIVHISANPI